MSGDSDFVQALSDVQDEVVGVLREKWPACSPERIAVGALADRRPR